MKKILLVGIVSAALILGACAKTETKISAEQAKEIALTNAGLSKDDVTFIKAEQDRDDGRVIFEVEFYTKDNIEYDYEIDADTGNVLSYDSEAEGRKPGAASAGVENSQPSAEAVSPITEEKAKEIALAKVPGATGENIREFKKDFDNGREEYEGKIVYDKKEYEFEIDAKTGEIITWETESVFD